MSTTPLHIREPNVQRLLLTLLFIFPCFITQNGCGGAENDSNPDQAMVGTTAEQEKGYPIVDAYGDSIMLSTPPTRIISLAPNLTEILFFLGRGAMLVGRTDFCDFPPEATTIESVGTLDSYNHEKMIDLKPDLVLMMTFDGSSRGEYDRLKELGLRPIAFSEGDIDHIIDVIDSVSMVTGEVAETRSLTDSLRHLVDSVRLVARSFEPVTSFVVIDKSPLMTTSRGFINDVIVAAGGVNIAGDDPIPYPRYSRELLLRKDPDALLVPDISGEIIDELLKLYPEWKEMSAVRNNHFFLLPRDAFVRPGPRLIDGLLYLSRLYYEMRTDSVRTNG